jgi:hypothetical protein
MKEPRTSSGGDQHDAQNGGLASILLMLLLLVLVAVPIIFG